MPIDTEFNSFAREVTGEMAELRADVRNVKEDISEMKADIKALRNGGNGKNTGKALDVALKALAILGAVLAGWVGGKI